MGKEKRLKDYKFDKKQVKLSLISDSIILYIENCKDSAKNNFKKTSYTIKYQPKKYIVCTLYVQNILYVYIACMYLYICKRTTRIKNI